MIINIRFSFWLALICFVVFILVAFVKSSPVVREVNFPLVDRVVIAAPVLLVLNGGDNFLAANLETMRLSATAMDAGELDAGYLMRAQRVVAELNPCQEHNYYLANALLTWGGAIEEGEQILKSATRCRFWDEWPPFFLGFNKYFFKRDITEARKYLEFAAQRATGNAAGFRKLAIMVKVDQIKDEKLALDFLRNERDKAVDSKLKDMLTKRALRVEGLVMLRDAQRLYEKRFGRPLQAPEQLISSGVLQDFPTDPLKLGYEFLNGRFVLKRLKIAGVEEGF